MPTARASALAVLASAADHKRTSFLAKQCCLLCWFLEQETSPVRCELLARASPASYLRAVLMLIADADLGCLQMHSTALPSICLTC